MPRRSKSRYVGLTVKLVISFLRIVDRRPNLTPAICFQNIRRKMVDIITKEVSSADLKETVNKLIPDSIGKDIEKACQSIYPLYDVFINKVKVMPSPATIRFSLFIVYLSHIRSTNILLFSGTGLEASSFRLRQAFGHARRRQGRRGHGDRRGRGGVPPRGLRAPCPRFRLRSKKSYLLVS